MIFDSHMHVGDFPLFNVSMDRDGLVAEMRQKLTAGGYRFSIMVDSIVTSPQFLTRRETLAAAKER